MEFAGEKKADKIEFFSFKKQSGSLWFATFPSSLLISTFFIPLEISWTLNYSYRLLLEMHFTRPQAVNIHFNDWANFMFR